MKRLMVLILTILSFGIAKAEAGKILNEHLPEWINVDLQFRHRFEYQDNLDFFEDLLALSSPEYLTSIKEAREEYKNGEFLTHEQVFGQL